MMMRKEFPEAYNFFPETYILPYEMNAFKKQFYTKKDKEEKEQKDHQSPERNDKKETCTDN